ncbi:MAG: ATPase domain-containing protein [Promethearchaeota archaeon]
MMLSLHTGYKELDYLLDGGIHPGRITEFYGHTCTGKTQIIHQIIVNSYLPENKDGLNGGILHIDTNGDFSPERIIQLCESKGLDHESIFNDILLIRLINEARLLDMFNIIEEIVQNQQVKLITIDSLTWPLIKMIDEKQINESSLEKLYDYLIHLIEKFPSLSIVYTSNYVKKNHLTSYMTHANITRVKLQNVKGKHKRAELIQPSVNSKQIDFNITKDGLSDHGID